MNAGLTVALLNRLFEALNLELEKTGTVGELYLVGGAVMCLAFEARPATKDVDGFFIPKERVRLAASRVGADFGVGEKWLNDAVKGFLSERGSFDPYLDLSHLKVFAARPEYLLAMKCLSMRLGPEFHDEADVRYLLRYLNIENYDEAIDTITRYYPKERFPNKALYAIEEILGE